MEPISLAAWITVGLALLVAGFGIGWFIRSLSANRTEARLGAVIDELMDDVNRFHLEGDWEGVPVS